MPTYNIALFFAALILNSLLAMGQDTIWYNIQMNKTLKKEEAEYFRPPAVKVGKEYLFTSYYISGAKQMQGNSLSPKEEKWNGKVIWYYPDGDIERTIEFVKGELNGDWIDYHGDGKIAYQATFKNNTLSGFNRRFYYNGQTSSSTFFNDGDVDGEALFYYRDGSLKEKRTFRKGKMDGRSLEYDINGKLTREVEFKNGEYVKGLIPEDQELYVERLDDEGEPTLLKAWLPPIQFTTTKQGEESIYKAFFVFDGFQVTCTYGENEDLIRSLKLEAERPKGNEINFYFTKHSGVRNKARYHGFRLGQKAALRLSANHIDPYDIADAICQLIPEEKLMRFAYLRKLDEAIEFGNGESSEVEFQDIWGDDFMEIPEGIYEGPALEDPIFTIVEKMPEFPGGDAALMKFISDTIHYPIEEAENTKNTTVYIKFVINKEGNVQDAEVARSGGEYFDAEALKAVRALPTFKPATQRGKPVAVYFTLPIQFKAPEPKPDE